MLVEFTRAVQPSDFPVGEDDGVAVMADRMISINPVHVSAVFESTQAPDVVIIRLADGRGFSIRGTYADVTEKLAAAGRLN